MMSLLPDVSVSHTHITHSDRIPGKFPTPTPTGTLIQPGNPRLATAGTSSTNVVLNL